jgi:hypothetical protein
VAGGVALAPMASYFNKKYNFYNHKSEDFFINIENFKFNW